MSTKELKEQRRREKISEARRRAIEMQAIFRGASRRAWTALIAAEAALRAHTDDPLAAYALREAEAAWDVLTTSNWSARALIEEFGIPERSQPVTTE